jgi:hypothetical protein
MVKMSSDKQEMIEIKNKLTALTGAYCSQHINTEYVELCQALIQKMARKKSVPFTSGRLEIWAAAVVHAIGTINFLFDKNTKPYASVDDISNYFGTSKSTTNQKSKVIRDMFKLWHYDAEFSTKAMAKNNPLDRMAMINGYIVMLDQ